MSKIKSIKEALGRTFIVSLLIPFYLIVLMTMVSSAIYLKNELAHDEDHLVRHGEEVLGYEIELAAQMLEDSFATIESGLISEDEIRLFLDQKLSKSKVLQDIVLLDSQGSVVETDSENIYKIGFDYKQSESFMNAVTERVTYSSALLSDVDGYIVFNLSYKGENGQVMIAKFIPDGFQKIVEELSADDNMNVALTTGDGVFLAHSNYTKVLERGRELRFSELKSSGALRTTMYYEDELYSIRLEEVGHYDLYLITYTKFFTYYKTMAILAGITLLIVILITVLSMKYLGGHTSTMIKSIENLVDLTGEVSTGNYGFQLGFTNYDELNKLVDHFNQMSLVVKENFAHLSASSHKLEKLNKDLILQNERIRKNESQIERILESTYDGIMLIDTKANILRHNKALLELFEIDPKELKTKMRCGDMFAEETGVCKTIQTDIQQKIVSRQSRFVEFNDKLIEENTSPLFEADKVIGYIKTYKDITSRKALEKQVNRATKMEAIGRLTSGIAHDFNNILQVIVGYSELAYYQLEQLESSEDILSKIKSINDAALKAERLIRKLMTFSKMDQVAKEPMNINDCVIEISQMLGRIIGDNIVLEMSLSEDLAQVYADKTQLEQIIVNLCVNAKDAILGHGTITIKTYETLRKSGCFICLEVSDDGKGMPEAIKEKIFEPFFTTKGLGHGTGLGLATVLGIVEGHGGIIELDSEEGVGTTFRIIFPNDQLRAMSLYDDSLSQTKFDYEGLKVLFVEDDEMLLEIHKNQLEQAGIEVYVANNGVEATQLYRNISETIDVVVLDSVIPEMGAFDVLDRMKEINENSRVILTTGYNDDAMIRTNERYKNVRYLPKPYKSQELIKAIEMVVYATNL